MAVHFSKIYRRKEKNAVLMLDDTEEVNLEFPSTFYSASLLFCPTSKKEGRIG